jgi:hypothetical protein
MSHPDISRAGIARTGLRVHLTPVRLSSVIYGNGKDWDLFGVIGMVDESGEVRPHAVSLAVKATKRQMRELVQRAEGRYMMVSGKYGPEERSPDGLDVFRRVYCTVADIRVLANTPIYG